MSHNLNFNEQTGKYSFYSHGYVKLYITVTGYFQNVRGYKDEDEKINSILCGGTAQKKAQAAFNLCASFAKHGEEVLNLN